VRVASVADLRGEGPFAVSAEGADLVVLRGKTSLRAYEGRCPHQGALLGEGEIDADALVCRNHRWRFDRETGKRVGGRECLRACPVKEEGGELLADVAALEAARPVSGVAARVRTMDELPGPRGLPVVGSFFDLELEKLHLVFEDWRKEHGPVFAVRVGPRRLVVLSDPEAMQTILRARPETFRRISTVEAVFDEMGVSGVFSAEGAAWRAQRKLAMEALSHRHLRGFYPTLARVAERLHARWTRAARERRELDLNDELKRFTVDVTTQLVFGHDVDTLSKGFGDEGDDVIQRDLERVFPAFNRRLNALFPYWRYLKSREDRRLDRALSSLRAWLGTLIDRARTRLAAEPAIAEQPSNFLEAMLVARDEHGQPFSDDVLFGNAMTMLLAGEDTTAYTLAWTVHHLCDADHALRAVRDEVSRVLGEASVPGTMEAADRLLYAGAAANEAMRLRPIAPMFFVEPNTDVVLAGVAIPRGTGITGLMRVNAVDPSRFTDAAAFRPERWLDGAAGFPAHDASVFMPFGSGPRICPGRTLALLEMRVVLATLYRSFDVERVGSSRDVVERTAFTMMPSGLRVRLRAR
jgi:cytochrome P450/nitrite reductase/ring-hydroxylating ferredoxin subunit